MKRWEYRVRSIPDGVLMKKIQEYGNEGWEVYQITPTPDKTKYVVHMKRQKGDEQD